jgi:hypothetical protein
VDKKVYFRAIMNSSHRRKFGLRIGKVQLALQDFIRLEVGSEEAALYGGPG